MIVLGANIAKTYFGLPLNDGGACLMIDGQIVGAIQEERLSRAKYAPGFLRSMQTLLESNSLTIHDVDIFALSSCCGPKHSNNVYYVSTTPDTTTDDLSIPRNKIHLVDHHVSHAYSSYFLSGYEDALVMVTDGEGNAMEPFNEVHGLIREIDPDGTYREDYMGLRYWDTNQFQAQSYYFGKGSELKLFDSETSNANNIGLGELYRYFTNFLGFDIYLNAGKTMGLAAYGDPKRFKGVRLINVDSQTGKISALVKPNYENPSESLKNYFKEKYNLIIEGRVPGQDITQHHMDLAYLVQSELNRAFLEKLEFLQKHRPFKKLCIAGGVGLNSVANGYVQDRMDIEIFIPPASGDSGESIGNAIYGSMLNGNACKQLAPFSPYLGPQYDEHDIEKLIRNTENITAHKFDSETLYQIVAKYIADGKIVGWFQGRSEIGPRALGHRSILCDPRDPDMKDYLNKMVKFREYFRPFAPSTLESHAQKYFKIKYQSPYMLKVCEVLPEARDIIPAVTHVDGTARVQTVSDSSDPFYKLIEEFYRQTGVAVLLNTSFNIAGDPIVESPADAIECCLKTNINYVVIGNYVIEKTGQVNKDLNYKDRIESILMAERQVKRSQKL